MTLTNIDKIDQLYEILYTLNSGGAEIPDSIYYFTTALEANQFPSMDGKE